MDKTAQDFARKILAALERAVHLLSRIEANKPTKDPEHPIGHQKPSDDTPHRQQSPSAVRAEIKIPTALVEEYASSNRNNEKQQRKGYRIQIGLLIATTAAFIAAAIYAWIAHQQLVTMREQFVKDQRPYLIPTQIAPEQGSNREELAAGKIISWRIRTVNFGRTPAVNMTGNQQIYFGPNAESEVDQYFNQLPKILTQTGGSQAFRPPNGLGEPDFSTAKSDRPLTESDVAFINSNDFGIYVVGRLQYEDLEGNIYSTDFCYTTFLTGAIPMCPKHNVIR